MVFRLGGSSGVVAAAAVGDGGRRTVVDLLSCAGHPVPVGRDRFQRGRNRFAGRHRLLGRDHLAFAVVVVTVDCY